MPSPPRPEPATLKRLQAKLLSELSALKIGDPEARAQLFRTPPQGTIEDRWHIYTSGYVPRIAEALEDDYPAVRRILGPSAFESLIRRYVTAHPPRSFDLRYAGDRLASFLEHDPLTGKLPFLPDLARLEWLLAEAFVATDPEPLLWSDLQAMNPEAVSDLPLVLNPGVAVIRSGWPLTDIWKCKDKPNHEVSVQIEGRPTVVLVFRHRLQARCRSMDEEDARFIEAAGNGASLAEIQATLVDGDDPDVTRQLLERFRRLVGEGLFLKPGRPHVAASP